MLNGYYSVNKKKRFKTHMKRSVLCDYSISYIAAKEKTNIRINTNNNKPQKDTIIKNIDHA